MKKICILISFLALVSCTSTPNSEPTKYRQDASLKVYQGCGCGTTDHYENKTAIAFTHPEGVEFSFIQERIKQEGNRLFIPLYLSSENARSEGTSFTSQEPDFILHLLSQLEHERGITILSWKVECGGERREHIATSIWVEFENLPATKKVDIVEAKNSTKDDAQTFKIKKGQTLNDFGLNEKQALAYAEKFNLKHWRNGEKLIVQLKEGEEFSLKPE